MDVNKIFREIGLMAKRLPAWRFLVLALIGLLWVAAPFITAIRWW